MSNDAKGSFEITNVLGLHARAATKLVQLASKYPCDVTLTKDGGSQVYLMNAHGSNVSRVLTSPGIDTEAMFTPDGQSLVFTSDRGGTPQIYRASLNGGQVERLTFEGEQHAIEIYGAIMVIFFCISFPLTRLSAYLERRLA